MEKNEWTLLIIFWFFSGLIGYIITQALYGIVLACLIVTYPTLFIYRVFKYSKKYGIYRLPPLACYIYDETGLVGSFKSKDWTLVEQPTELITEKQLRIKKYDLEERKFLEQNSIIELDYTQEYFRLLDSFLKQLIPDPSEQKNPQSLDYLLIKSGNRSLIEQYEKLSYEQKINVSELARTILAFRFIQPSLPKVYQIASMENKIYIYWFANALPHEYSTYRTRLRFTKWNIVPWISGFPVVEMWGKVIEKYQQVIGNTAFTIIYALPLQDEQYRKERHLNIMKYGIYVDALGKYTENIMQAIPTIKAIELIKYDKEVAEKVAVMYKDALEKTLASMSELSTFISTVISLLVKASSIVSKTPEIPEPLKQELTSLIPEAKEKESRIEKLKESIRGLLLGKPEETKPPSGVQPLPQTTEKKGETTE